MTYTCTDQINLPDYDALDFEGYDEYKRDPSLISNLDVEIEHQQANVKNE